MNDLKLTAIEKMKTRGVFIIDICEIIYQLQKDYIPDITIDQCKDDLNSVLNKREVIHAILTAIAIDECAEKNILGNDISTVINSDDGLYGVDEVLALSIVNLYGSIALTNFGYLDKLKPGIIGRIDELGKNSKVCHTFLDDIVCALAAAASSKIAHTKNQLNI